ncbi:hypothetical protein CYMTET_22655 [Cymbomonas tetramitiformis]|uniref:Uncharacterized protein n=1 Tax=Cymbomonas tetramitiformis TaxID=36881 RepID=A0AAE0G0W4_9CHLO|nr:hypothetical protein CYMTET_22655 [Cymbomonas tetramitiformis]
MSRRLVEGCPVRKVSQRLAVSCQVRKVSRRLAEGCQVRKVSRRLAEGCQVRKVSRRLAEGCQVRKVSRRLVVSCQVRKVSRRLVEGFQVRKVSKTSRDTNGELRKVAATRLDSEAVRTFFNTNILCYKPELYWWGCYDMFRRVFQTSVVVIIQLMDTELDLLYALTIAIIFLSHHSLTMPYIRPEDNAAQLAVLMGHSIVLSVILKGETDDAYDFALGMLLLSIQILLVTYFVYALVQEYRDELTRECSNLKQSLKKWWVYKTGKRMRRVMTTRLVTRKPNAKHKKRELLELADPMDLGATSHERDFGVAPSQEDEDVTMEAQNDASGCSVSEIGLETTPLKDVELETMPSTDEERINAVKSETGSSELISSNPISERLLEDTIGWHLEGGIRLPDSLGVNEVRETYVGKFTGFDEDHSDFISARDSPDRSEDELSVSNSA